MRCNSFSVYHLVQDDEVCNKNVCDCNGNTNIVVISFANNIIYHYLNVTFMDYNVHNNAMLILRFARMNTKCARETARCMCM